MSKDYIDASPEYWGGYSNLQRVKHELIRQYLNGWFPKLGTWAQEVQYFDTHAGRGKHLSGELGSPLVALDTLLKHSSFPKLRNQCTFRFVLMERDQQNFEALEAQLARRQLPAGVVIEPRTGDCFEYLRSLITSLAGSAGRLAPAFVFVDPYGFKIPGGVLRDLLQAGRVELFVNIMWREMHMGLERAEHGHAGWTQAFDFVFAGDEWRDLWTIGDPDAMGDQAVALLARKYGSRWSTTVRMLDGGRDPIPVDALEQP